MMVSSSQGLKRKANASKESIGQLLFRVFVILAIRRVTLRQVECEARQRRLTSN